MPLPSTTSACSRDQLPDDITECFDSTHRGSVKDNYFLEFGDGIGLSNCCVPQFEGLPQEVASTKIPSKIPPNHEPDRVHIEAYAGHLREHPGGPLETLGLNGNKTMLLGSGNRNQDLSVELLRPSVSLVASTADIHPGDAQWGQGIPDSHNQRSSSPSSSAQRGARLTALRTPMRTQEELLDVRRQYHPDEYYQQYRTYSKKPLDQRYFYHFDHIIKGAIEQPPDGDNVKSQRESCATCVKMGTQCKGTSVKAGKCECCQGSHKKQKRNCVWIRPDYNLWTYPDLQDALPELRDRKIYANTVAGREAKRAGIVLHESPSRKRKVDEASQNNRSLVTPRSTQPGLLSIMGHVPSSIDRPMTHLTMTFEHSVQTPFPLMGWENRPIVDEAPFNQEDQPLPSTFSSQRNLCPRINQFYHAVELQPRIVQDVLAVAADSILHDANSSQDSIQNRETLFHQALILLSDQAWNGSSVGFRSRTAQTLEALHFIEEQAQHGATVSLEELKLLALMRFRQ